MGGRAVAVQTDLTPGMREQGWDRIVITPGMVHTTSHDRSRTGRPVQGRPPRCRPSGDRRSPRTSPAMLSFRVSDDAAFITGQTLIANSGLIRS